MPYHADRAVNVQWTVVFDDHDAYLRSMDAIKRRQLAKGGARLAEIFNAIWPNESGTGSNAPKRQNVGFA